VAIVFADSSYWIALLNPEDEVNPVAERLSRQYKRILTTEMVLTEVANFFAGYGASLRGAAVSLIRALQNNANCRVIDQTHESFDRALDHYAQRHDKDWSLVDCASFLLMQEHQIYEALASRKPNRIRISARPARNASPSTVGDTSSCLLNAVIPCASTSDSSPGRSAGFA
jgi:uncharacterized protein